MESSTGQIKLPSTLDMGTTVPIAITGWEQSGMQYSNINLSVPRQSDHNELLAKVAKRAERAQLLVCIMIIGTGKNIIFISVSIAIDCSTISTTVVYVVITGTRYIATADTYCSTQ